MRILLLPFASVSDVLGERRLELEVEVGCSLADLKSLLEAAHPKLAPMWPGVALAINGELVGDEATLADGDEVALLPPVSGGSGETEDRLRRQPLSTNEAVRRVEHDSCGAVVVFVGNVRDRHADRPVEGILYTAYEPMAERRLRSIENDLEGQFPGARVAILHRLGELGVGEASVVIAVAAPHREDGYVANRLALERLKSEVPIWKKERYSDGESRWREEEALTREPVAPDAGAD